MGSLALSLLQARVCALFMLWKGLIIQSLAQTGDTTQLVESLPGMPGALHVIFSTIYKAGCGGVCL